MIRTSKEFLFSSLGKKIIMSLTGLFLILFCVIHLAGNFTLYLGPEAFNAYTYKMTHNKAILYFLEAGLIAGFGFHIVMAIWTSIKNRQARPVRYKKKKKLGMATIFSSTMLVSGVLILFFLVVHLKTFKYGDGELVSITIAKGEVVQIKNMYQIVVQSFKSLPYTLFYVVVVLFLGGHISHGFHSAFKSMGLYQNQFAKPLKVLAILVGILIGLGFASIPIYFYFY